MRNFTIKQCKVCGKQFPATTRNKNQPYCSKKCGGIGRQKIKPAYACLNCKSMVPRTRATRRAKFCTRKCALEYIHTHNIKTTPKFPYRGGNWREQRKKALIRDGYRCVICGEKYKRNTANIQVHHIRPYREYNGDWREANKTTNLVSLCRNCHIKVEKGYWACPQPLF